VTLKPLVGPWKPLPPLGRRCEHYGEEGRCRSWSVLVTPPLFLPMRCAAHQRRIEGRAWHVWAGPGRSTGPYTTEEVCRARLPASGPDTGHGEG